MSTKLTHRTTVYVPVKHDLTVSALGEATIKAARVAGGCTAHTAGGTWFNENGDLVQEQVSLVTYWFRKKDRGEMLDAVGDIIAVLLVAGEKSVMIEQHDPEQGTRAHLFYP